MRSVSYVIGVTLLATFVAATPAWAGFAGQTILGPLGPDSVVNGDTTLANDDNDGFSSGDHFFFIWNGPDDAWALEWPGGNLSLEMTYDNTFADLDLFLYTPDSYDDSGYYSIINSGVENIDYPAGAPGLYYVVVDSPDLSTAGAYTLSVTPEPGMLALFGVVAAMLGRRTR